MKDKKFLFLDFDGVLNPEVFAVAILDQIKAGVFTHENKPEFCSKTIANLNHLCEQQPEMLIVISSTWRHSGLQYCIDALVRNGFEYSQRVIDITPDTSERIRGVEILKWMQDNKLWHRDNKPTPYVIFDDDSDMLMWQAAHYVKIDPYIGLTHTNVYKANRILNGLI